MYSFKLWSEAGWAALVAAAAILGQMLIDLDAEVIADWQTWGIAGISSAARAALAAGLAVIAGSFARE